MEDYKKIYPQVPSAPPIPPEGENFRLQKSSEVLYHIENKMKHYENVRKKYKRVRAIFTKISGKWFEPRSLSRLCGLIIIRVMCHDT